MEGVLLANGEVGHIPCRHMVKEYEGFIFTLASFLNKDTYLTILTRCQPLFSQSNSPKGSYEGVPYLFHTPITLTLPKRNPRDAFKWLIGYINDFPKDNFMLFQPTISMSITHTRRIPLRLSTSSFFQTFFYMVPYKLTFSLCSRPCNIHSQKTKRLQYPN